MSKVVALKPSIVLMPSNFIDIDGIEAAGLIKARFPECHIIELLDSADDREVRRCIAVGADACCMRRGPHELLKQAIAAVSKGVVWFDPGLHDCALRACASVIPSGLPWYPSSHHKAHPRRHGPNKVHCFLLATALLCGLFSVIPILDFFMYLEGLPPKYIDTLGPPTAPIPGMAYTFAELQCRAWNRYRPHEEQEQR